MSDGTKVRPDGSMMMKDGKMMKMSKLAEVVGADPRAGYVEFRSFDSGYWSSWDRESASIRRLFWPTR